MAGPKLKMPECLQSLRDLGQSHGIITETEYKQSIGMGVQYKDNDFQTAVRRIYFLAWAKPYVEDLSKKDEKMFHKRTKAKDIQMTVTLKIADADLANTATNYVDKNVKDRKATAIQMMHEIEHKSYAYPRRALMYVIGRCSEDARQGVSEYLTTLQKNKGINDKVVGEIGGRLSQLTEDIVQITRKLQKGTAQGSKKMDNLEKSQDQEQLKKDNRKKYADIDEDNDNLKGVKGALKKRKRKIARFFRSDGMTKKEKEAEKQKTEQAKQAASEITESGKQPETSTAPKPAVANDRGTQLEKRYKAADGWTQFYLVNHRNVEKKSEDKRRVNKFKWKKVMEVLNKMKAIAWPEGTNGWKALTTGMGESVEEGSNLLISIEGEKTKDEMIDLREELRRHGCTIRGDMK